MKFCYNIRILPFLNNLKYLDLSYKMDLDFWDCFGRAKPPSYKRRNTVLLTQCWLCNWVNLSDLPYFFDYKTEFFSFQNNPKDLDPSCKMDLDL